MSKFSKGKKRKEPAISTAALPDIVFMLLFFFMVTTVFKEKEADNLLIKKVMVKESIDLEKNVKAAYYWIGKVPGKKDDKGEPVYAVQLDDQKIQQIDSEIYSYLMELKKNPEFSDKWNTEFRNVFKVDSDTKMFLLKKVQDELKRAESLKVIYSVNKEN